MTTDTPRHPRMHHVTTAGTALAAALLPLVVGVLLAKAMAADPMSPVNAMITNGGHRAPVSPAHWSRCGRNRLRRRRAASRV